MAKEAVTTESIRKAIEGMPGTPGPSYPSPLPAPGVGETLAKGLSGVGSGLRSAAAGVGGLGKNLAKKLWEADLGVPTAAGVEKQISGMPGM
jgi:hypothetical protein